MPNYDLFIENITSSVINHQNIGSDLLIRLMLKIQNYVEEFDYEKMQNKIRYLNGSSIDEITELINYLTFKIHKPEEQKTNTFNSIVLKDIREWYPNILRDEPYIPPIISSYNIFEIDSISQNELYGDFIVKRKLPKEYNYMEFNNTDYILELLNEVEGLYLVGSYARQMLTGDKNQSPFFTLAKTNECKLTNGQLLRKMLELWVDKYYQVENKEVIENLIKMNPPLVRSHSERGYLHLRFSNREVITDDLFNDLEDINVFSFSEYLPMDISNEEIEKYFYIPPQNNDEFDIESFSKMNFEEAANYILDTFNGNYYDERIIKGNDSELIFETLVEYVCENSQNNQSNYPHFRLHLKTYDNLEEIFSNDDLLDFDRVIYKDGKFYTDELGKYALENKIHFTNHYDTLIDKMHQNGCFLTRGWGVNKFTRHEYEGYYHYDPNYKNIFKRLIDL